MSNIWTAEEALNGLCDLDDVGSPKPEAAIADAPLDAATQADILDTLVENSVTPATQAKFNKWAEANPGSYFPLLAKHNLAKNMKEQSKAPPKLDVITDEQIATLSTAELKRIVLNWAKLTSAGDLEKARGA